MTCCMETSLSLECVAFATSDSHDSLAKTLTASSDAIYVKRIKNDTVFVNREIHLFFRRRNS